MIHQPSIVLEEWKYQYFSHINAQESKFDFYVEISKVNLELI